MGYINMAFKRIKIKNLYDYLHIRPTMSVYCAKLTKHDMEVDNFLLDYFEFASKCGVIVENGLQNPSNDNLSFMKSKISDDFVNDKHFIEQKLKAWLPRLDNQVRSILSDLMFSTFNDLKSKGKNDSVLRNIYIKMMCWLYFKFENILSWVGGDKVPKILYEGKLSIYSLSLLKVLSSCGCDVLILDYDKSINDQDIQNLTFGTNEFSSEFNLKIIKSKLQERYKILNLLGTSKYIVATNIWLKGESIEEIKNKNRGDDENYIYNAFIKVNGVDDITSYNNYIYNFKKDLEKDRYVYVFNSHVNGNTDFSKMKRKSKYDNIEDLTLTIKDNIYMPSSDMISLFNHVLYGFIKEKSNSMQIKEIETLCLQIIYNLKACKGIFNLSNFGVLIIFKTELFNNLDKNFLAFVVSLGIDVLILNPSKLESDFNNNKLYEISYDNSCKIDKFPEDLMEASYSTVAYNAENELTDIMYKDSGIYRDNQFKKMKSVILRTTFEEIELLWNEPLNMRNGFSTDNNCVIVPTIFAKIVGVKNDNNYHSSIINNLAKANNVFFLKILDKHTQESKIGCAKYFNEYRRVNSDEFMLGRNKLDFNRIKTSKLYDGP